MSELGRLGEIRVDAVKTGINFAGRAHFAGAIPQRSGLSVGFVLRRRVEDPRIRRVEWVGGPWYGHRVRVDSPEDVDEQLLAWLAEAYAVKGAAADPAPRVG